MARRWWPEIATDPAPSCVLQQCGAEVLAKVLTPHLRVTLKGARLAVCGEWQILTFPKCSNSLGRGCCHGLINNTH